MAAEKTVTVWDPLVRLFHWSLVIAFAVSWITADEWDKVHEISGYVIAGLVAFRLCWGLVGPRYARFRQFVRSPLQIKRHVLDVLQFRGPRYIGHNPAGGLMIVALLLVLAITATCGWLMTTDMFWGSDLMEEIHEFFANCLIVMVVIHVGGVVFESLLHNENLAKSMINGRKRAPSESDIT